MNLLLAILDRDRGRCEAATGRLARHAQACFGATPEIVTGAPGAEGPALALCRISDGGAVLGFADDGNCALAVQGDLFEGGVDDAPDTLATRLLARWHERGEAFLDGVEGHFVVMVLDRGAGRIVTAVDGAGVRAACLYEADGAVIVATNLGALAAALGDRLALDRSREDFFLTFGFYPDRATPYLGVRMQAPGTVLSTSDTSTGTHAIAPAPGEGKGVPANEDAAVEALHDCLLESTAEMLPRRPSRVAVLLGGFDSALVAAVIARLGHTVETYSFHYDDARYNQPHTDTVAEHLGIRHHWVAIRREDVEAGMGAYAERFLQPTNWPNYVVQTETLCRRIREDGIVRAYSGDGCDAVFLGYPGTYRRARIVAALSRMPPWLVRGLLNGMRSPRADRLLGHPYRFAIGQLRGLTASPEARSLLSFRVMDRVTIDALRRDGAPAQVEPLEATVERLAAPHAALEPLRRAYLGKSMVSPNRAKLLGSADSSGVSIMSPYMHPALKRLAMALPETLMRPDGERRTATGKHVLSLMAERTGLLPRAVIHQPKLAAVDAPVDAWYAGPMRETMLGWFEDLPFDTDPKLLEAMLTGTLAERLAGSVMKERVLSHAASLLATYARFTARASMTERNDDGPDP